MILCSNPESPEIVRNLAKSRFRRGLGFFVILVSSSWSRIDENLAEMAQEAARLEPKWNPMGL